MNSRDKQNLDFLLNVPAEEFEDWLDVATDDDVDYALELIRKHKAEKFVEIMEIEEVMYSFEEDMMDAKEVIGKIKKKNLPAKK